MIEYKGYVGMVEFDDYAGCFHGRVVNSGPYSVVTFEATDAEGVQREFRRSVDEYLAWCEEEGVEPGKPRSGKLDVRLDSDLHRRILLSAEKSGMSLDGWIAQVLEKSVSC